MASITLQAQVGNEGQLLLKLPDLFRGAAVTVTIQAQSLSDGAGLEGTDEVILDSERPNALWLKEQAWIQNRRLAKSSVSCNRDWNREMLYDRHSDEEK